MESLESTINIKKYNYYSEDNKNETIATVTLLEESADNNSATIEIFDVDKSTIDLQLLVNTHTVSYDGAIECLKSRAMETSRMFFDEYCEKIGLDPYNLDDRLKISEGRSADDNIFVKIEEKVEHV